MTAAERAAVAVLTALRGSDDVRVLAALAASGGRATVSRRCGDLTELRAAAAAGRGTVALVGADAAGLDRGVVAELGAAGVGVLALTHDEAGVVGARTVGIEHVLDAGCGDEELVSAVLAAGVGPGGRPRTAAIPTVPGRVGGSPGDRRGRVVAVWGPTGAPGRTTLAINLAAELAGVEDRARSAGRRSSRRGRRPIRSGRRSLVVDADTYGGSVAQHLGMLEESPGLVAVARAAVRGMLDVDALAASCVEVAPDLLALTGIARAARWSELPAVALDEVWEVARELADWVVVDCGFGIEQDEVLSYDTRAPQRNGATLSALAAADVVVVVGAADPVGVHRLVRALGDLDDAAVGVTAARVVVANRVRTGAAGAGPVRSVREVLGRFAGVEQVQVVPEDQGAFDRALLAGRTLAEVAPGSSARAAVVSVAERLVALVPERTGASVPAACEG